MPSADCCTELIAPKFNDKEQTAEAHSFCQDLIVYHILTSIAVHSKKGPALTIGFHNPNNQDSSGLANIEEST
jgi:hypothetical protein